MVELYSMSYEESRAEHFKALMKKMQRKIDWWQARENKLRPLDMASRSHIECSEAGIQYNFYKDALEALENQPKWISVKDELPEPFHSVLVHMPQENPLPTVHEGYRTDDGHWYSAHFVREFDEVAHWMPLPEPPKEDA